MCTTKVSPTPDTGSPVASISMPELSMSTWPCGSHSTRKMVAGSAAIVRWTSMRSVVMASSCQRSAGRENEGEGVEHPHDDQQEPVAGDERHVLDGPPDRGAEEIGGEGRGGRGRLLEAL